MIPIAADWPFHISDPSLITNLTLNGELARLHLRLTITKDLHQNVEISIAAATATMESGNPVPNLW